MRRPRFLILAARNGPLPAGAADRLMAMLGTQGNFSRIWSSQRAVMAVDGPHLRFDHGAIAGFVFRRGSPDPLASLSAADTGLIAAGGGQFLVDAHWGGYVALIEQEQGISVLRAPLGDLGCLVATGPDGIAIASDMALLHAAGCRATIDYEALARHLAAPDLRRAETCLAGVEELQGGSRLDLGDGEHRVEQAWSPWTVAAPSKQLSDPDEARCRLRDAVRHAVAASCRPHGKVVLRLSGGLDSSIVAVALAEAGIETIALNLLTEDAASDERRYARLVAEATGIKLVERRRQLDSVDLEVSAAANLPRPTARAFVQSVMQQANPLADDACAGALVDGGGGDNVFCSLQSIRPVVDCMMSGTGWNQVRDTARSVAMLAQVSLWTVLRRAWVARARHVSRYDFPLDVRLLSTDAARFAHGGASHGWLDSPDGALPGKAAHIGLIAVAQSVVEGFDPRDPLPLVSPLISQPVIETCLRIPSWLWFDRGHNRAVARQAFADRLPIAIVERRSKGGPDGFIAQLYHHRRDRIREMLLDGLLAANGLLDRSALDTMLAERGPVQSHNFIRVMQLVDAEAWARCR